MKKITWERIGALGTVRVYKPSEVINFDYLIQDLMDNSSFKNIHIIEDKFLVFTSDVYFSGFNGLLLDYQNLVSGKKKITKFAKWYDFYLPEDYVEKLRHIILDEKEINEELYYKNDLAPYRKVYELTLMNAGIVRDCRDEKTGKITKVAQGCEIFKMHVVSLDKAIVAFDRMICEGYLFYLHETREGEQVLMKHYLRKWGFYLFEDKEARIYALNRFSKKPGPDYEIEDMPVYEKVDVDKKYDTAFLLEP